jgi:alkylhydroperoxidase family enzyme
MLLRESGWAEDKAYDVRALTDPAVASGVDDGDVLLAFTAALAGPDRTALDRARAELEARMGPAALVEASVIAAHFSMLDRVANAIGIPLDPPFERATREYRGALGMDRFRSARNTPGVVG